MFLGMLVQVMTPNPECAGLDTTLVDALHTMHDGKFLHLPVTDRGEYDTLLFCVLRFNLQVHKLH